MKKYILITVAKIISREKTVTMSFSPGINTLKTSIFLFIVIYRSIVISLLFKYLKLRPLMKEKNLIGAMIRESMMTGEYIISITHYLKIKI